MEPGHDPAHHPRDGLGGGGDAAHGRPLHRRRHAGPGHLDTEDRLVRQLDDLNLTPRRSNSWPTGSRRCGTGPRTAAASAAMPRAARCWCCAGRSSSATPPACWSQRTARSLRLRATSPSPACPSTSTPPRWPPAPSSTAPTAASCGPPRACRSGRRRGSGTADVERQRRGTGTGGAGSGPDGGGDLPTIVFTQDVTSELQPVRRWLVLAAIMTLGLGVAAAVALGRRLTRPLAAAQAATARIAAGDLSARVPEQDGTRRAERAGPLDQPDGRVPRTVAGARAAVPAVGLPRPAHAAHLDQGLRRGPGRRDARRRRQGRHGDPPGGRADSNASSATCWSSPASSPASSAWRSGCVDLAAVGRRAVDAFRTDGRRAGVELDWVGSAGPVRSGATTTASARCWRTSWRTPSSTRSAASRSGWVPTAPGAGWRSPTTAPASPPRTCPTSSSGSTSPSASPPGARPAPASDWRSCGSWSTPTAGEVDGRGRAGRGPGWSSASAGRRGVCQRCRRRLRHRRAPAAGGGRRSDQGVAPDPGGSLPAGPADVYLGRRLHAAPDVGRAPPAPAVERLADARQAAHLVALHAVVACGRARPAAARWRRRPPPQPAGHVLPPRLDAGHQLLARVAALRPADRDGRRCRPRRGSSPPSSSAPMAGTPHSMRTLWKASRPQRRTPSGMATSGPSRSTPASSSANRPAATTRRAGARRRCSALSVPAARRSASPGAARGRSGCAA